MSDTTIFDRIIRHEADADIVFEDDVVMAIRDINPQAPAHILVLPKRKVRNFAELAGEDPDAIGRYMQRVAKVAADEGLEKDGYRLVFNVGRNGQQSVDYLHAHILGNRQMQWPPG